MLRVFAIVFTAMSLIVLGDTAAKTLTRLDVPPFFIAWTRFALAAVLILPFAGQRRSDWAAFHRPSVLLRGVLVSGGVASILTALAQAPIADVFGAFFVGPMVAFLLSAVFLKEPVTAARIALLLSGFCGVLLVVKPGFGMAPGLGFALLAGVFYGGFLTLNRALANEIRPRFLLLSHLIVGSVVLAPLGLGLPLPAFTATIAALLTLSALASAAGNLLLVYISQDTPAGIVAPLVYTQLIAATLSGLVFFGDIPDAVSLLGLLVILVSGLATLALRQRVQ